MKFVIEQSKIRYAMYGSIQIKKLNKKHRNNLKNQCQLSSIPIFRMPVVLHAKYPHANCPHANSPNANCPSTVYINIYGYIYIYIIYIYIHGMRYIYWKLFVSRHCWGWLLCSLSNFFNYFLDNRILYNYVINIAAFGWLRLIFESKIEINLGVI